jgi:hypothetical protein
MDFRLRKKNKQIEFIAKTPYAWEVCPRPVPTKDMRPEWWTSMPPYSGAINGLAVQAERFTVRNRISNNSAKKCGPMAETFTSGYIIPLWSDVLVEIDDLTQERQINWRVTESVFEPHGDDSYWVEKFDGYDFPVMKFINNWLVKTPPGYSTLIVSPFGYKNLPWKAIPAIVDTDKTQLQLATPGYFKTGFQGIIPKGTPMVQLIPFKRDDWKSSFSFLKEDEYRRKEDKEFGSTLLNNYQRKTQVKKHYD